MANPIVVALLAWSVGHSVPPVVQPPPKPPTVSIQPVGGAKNVRPWTPPKPPTERR